MSQISEDNLQWFKEIFAVHDEKGDGKMCVKELEGALRCAGYNPTDEELKILFAEMDKDENQTIDVKEFIAFMGSAQEKYGTPEEQEAELEEAFKLFDRDGSGTIDRDEMKELLMMPDATEEEIDAMISDADTNGDGKIDIKEFAKFLATIHR